MIGKKLTATDIKNIRAKYGLSQQSFARILGIGEASIVRYENGAVPSRAIANLIRAADKPEFMHDCLEREAERIGPELYDRTSKVIYSLVQFDEKGEVMDINRIYEITLQQEILNEKAARILADIDRMQMKAEEAGDETLVRFLEVVAYDVAVLKPTIIDEANATEKGQAILRGKFEALEALARRIAIKAA